MPSSATSVKAGLLQGKQVAIIGAGPAGLTLARILQIRGIEGVRVFERDSSPEARAQGGSLDLHEDSGQRAIHAADLTEAFDKKSRPEGQSYKVLDKHAVVRLAIQPEDVTKTRPEIDRGELRSLFLGSLRTGTVVWDHHLREIVPIDGDRYRLSFENGKQITTDFLIGADGAWSRVRPLVSSLLPTYSGATFIETGIMSPDLHAPAIAKLVGEGAMLALGEKKGLMCQRNGDGYIRIYVALCVPEHWADECGIDFFDAPRARTGLLQLFAGWDPSLLDMLHLCDDRFIPRPLYGFPHDQSWETRPGVAIIGDAAHLMPPFAGKGANMAMLDAVELAEHLTQGGFETLTDAVTAFEKSMLQRMSEAILDTAASQELILASDAPASLVGEVPGRLGAAGIADQGAKGGLT